MTGRVVPKLEDPHKQHVFIAHAQNDSDLSIELMQYLENYGLKCMLAERDFVPGNLVCDNIINAINTSRRVLLVLSRAFLESGWCTFEVIVAMEKMNNDNNVIIVPLLVDVVDDNVPQMLRHMTYVSTSTPGYRELLARALTGCDVKVSDLLPAGNVAHGLAWNYYCGYLSFVLPDLGNKIQNSKWWTTDRDRVIARRLYILIPLSCACKDSLTDVDPLITFDGSLEGDRKSRAGNMNRVYRQSVWRIERRNEQDLFFAGEFATVLDTMHLMEVGQAAGMSSENRKYQVQRFCKTLVGILEHPQANRCQRRFSLVMYDDRNEDMSLSSILTKRILEDVQLEEDYDATSNVTFGMASIRTS
ncbi:stimulator of interferon genes protein-like [Haliotis cracherodii]|uniref:stimulator of interferon genes protein-like n=1 Tax=Haliotis cracherodii TaxID=6455 RepID=UPI0039E7AD95